ncbi:outer membrane protein assembly factor BamB family protein [Gimesia algae]|uniref:Outer membrane biogenesis protein BamB n=1 Tax=Gimesia algae TaxID=2527971 RepID=A0A517V740_9PLAN|nr:PhnD/SsuA/transferrin family substrate-binding protein [Gimesia algae]QDT88818.1 outer membrane biogenesis protein BamB [Gimesia algae]
MTFKQNSCLLLCLMCCLSFSGLSVLAEQKSSDNAGSPQPLTLIIMDPLAAPLSCPCVKGYAQRKYETLGEYLETQLGRKVEVQFTESLAKALPKNGNDQACLIIGKQSVVLADATALKLKVQGIARLSDLQGETTQTGLIVVSAQDPAQHAKDLQGYRIFFGPSECDEKHQAALSILKNAHVPIPDKLEISQACSDGACKILEFDKDIRAAAVISSYAKPLLQGCGTIKKGDLRVVAETKPVPFITAFTGGNVNPAEQKQITAALLNVVTQPELCKALESLMGFVPIETAEDTSKPVSASGKKKIQDPQIEQSSAVWPGWLGPHRNGSVTQLPKSLPATTSPLWNFKLAYSGLGGIAATQDRVIFGDRGLDNQSDLFRCLSASDGKVQWVLEYLAPGELDYGTSPRATPLVYGDLVFLLGAFGDLHCVEIKSGKVFWKKNLYRDFGQNTRPTWGACSSPLIVENRLIVNPGAKAASLVALDPRTGKTLWQTPGNEAAYGSFIAGKFGGRLQVVGHDAVSLGGWDVKTGQRLWTVIPAYSGDFNVPTPLAINGQLLVTTENNGTRLYGFDSDGIVIPRAVAINEDLNPDMSSPIQIGDHVYCIWNDMYCLNWKNGLKTAWNGPDKAFGDYAALITDSQRILVIGKGGRLVLVDANTEQFKVNSRLNLFIDPGNENIFSHCALVGNRLYLRGESELICVDLSVH